MQQRQQVLLLKGHFTIIYQRSVPNTLIDQLTLAQSRSCRTHKPNTQFELCEAVSLANDKAKAAQSVERLKKKYKYISLDGSEYSTDPEDNEATLEPPSIKVVSEDGEFIAYTSGTDGSESDEDVAVENDEVADILPRKTEPLTKKAHEAALHANDIIKGTILKKRKRRTKKQYKLTAAENPAMKKLRREDSTATMSEAPSEAETGFSVKKPAIYHFFEQVPNNTEGCPGEHGDKHYRCYHGKHKILTITRKMKGSQNGLIGHLRTHFPAMNRLYEELKSRKDSPPMVLELQMAAGQIPLDSPEAVAYIKGLEKKAGNGHSLVDMFNLQAAKTEV
ncbi:hypothetical protein M422DRAFT_43145 [Sphaerobolus stellatus SS14]|nr:hypothetical protein M422DRAFT_43145 [Sphaerobolus stellatus SS14]